MQWRGWLHTNPYPAWIDEDRHTGRYRLFYDFAVPLPPEFPVRVGEIAHDLRSALDHLVWREAVERLGHEPTDDEAREIAFPLCRSRVKFKKSKVRGYVSPDAWAIIERYQPYDRGKPKRSKALALVHWINRIDKHRLLHGSTVYLQFFNPLRLIDFDPLARLIAAPIQHPIGTRLKGKTEVACFTFDSADLEPNVSVKGTPPLTVSYGKSPRYLRRVEITETIIEVRRAVDDFADLLP